MENLAVFPADEAMGLPERRFQDFQKVEKEISDMTERIAGTGISEKRIVVRIYSPDFPDLQLVDLPGFIEVAREGEKEQIEQMAEKFIVKGNAIILAVSEATVDISNSKALNFAKKVDPDGARTIGILTKIDQVKDGTDKVIKILNNKVLPLKLGYFGLVNRSLRQVEAGIRVKEGVREAETELSNVIDGSASLIDNFYLGV